MKTEFFEESVPIGAIKELLRLGWEIEVSSPDGWVPVNQFVDKGQWEEYRLETESGKVVRCNENHLFETPNGWVYAKDLLGDSVVLTQDGPESAICIKSGKTIPIVDIQVDHPNHRYYTEGVSSHNTGVGKSLAMCHMAASSLTLGKNVLYITMEMSEERIAERIDANLMNIPVDQLETMPKDTFESKIAKIATKTTGRLIIKEYPTASAHAGHFRALINELKLKKDFAPDIIFIDYLNICASSRIKGLGNSINTYSFVKAIAEEIRGLAVEFDVPIWSATQTTRQGFSSTDVDITDTSECIKTDQTITLRDGTTKRIGDVNVGDQIKSQDGYKTVMLVHHKKFKKCFKIVTKSGKEIVVSEDHVFPTNRGRLSLKSGLSIGDRLNTI